MEEGGPKVASANDLLGSGHTGEVSIASTCMKIVEYAFGFHMSEATTNKGVNTLLLKSIANKKVTVGLMANALSIIASDMGGGGEFWCVSM